MSWLNRVAAAAGLFVLNGAIAFGGEMKVDVPFAFQTPGANMPAGTYYIADARTNGSVALYRVQHAETGKTVMALAGYEVQRSASDISAKVAFRCLENRCALAEIYSYGANRGGAVPVNLKAQRNQQVALVVLPAFAR